MKYVAALVAAGIIAVCVIGQGHAAVVHRYRRPYAALIGISPTRTLVFKCHNKNFRIPKVYGFGGCKEIAR